MNTVFAIFLPLSRSMISMDRIDQITITEVHGRFMVDLTNNIEENEDLSRNKMIYLSWGTLVQ